MRAISNPRHKEHKALLRWVGGSFDPGAFDPATVTFDDPRQRFKRAFEEDDQA